uniref:Cerebellin 20 n=1 Tax=Tetraodon nigroviridis TaxID=99883 RepID=H3C2S2_TETNG
WLLLVTMAILKSNKIPCCLMLQEVEKLRTQFNKSLDELEQVYQTMEQSLSKIKALPPASSVAASVALYSNDSFKCLGPFSSRQDIIYKHVFLNLGNSYDKNSGTFTVPRSGVYSLALTVYSDAGAPDTTLAACAALQVNGLMLAEQSEQNTQDQEDSATAVVALHLKAGDVVSVSLGAGCFLCDDHNHYNTFSVFLLYAE